MPSGWPHYHLCSWLHSNVAPRSTISDIQRTPHPNPHPPVGTYTIPLPLSRLDSVLQHFYPTSIPLTNSNSCYFVVLLTLQPQPAVPLHQWSPPSDMSYNIQWWVIWWPRLTVWLELSFVVNVVFCAHVPFLTLVDVVLVATIISTCNEWYYYFHGVVATELFKPIGL